MSISIAPFMYIGIVAFAVWVDVIGWNMAIKKIINSFGV